ncbi:hypothetical protein [Actinoplanes sp. NPDC048796]|uniref:M48 family metallopeptidase n=1 Tax=Actinoplanes sp. NPDC048796 TaxID=3155640 RepID=UPI0033CD0B21
MGRSAAMLVGFLVAAWLQVVAALVLVLVVLDLLPGTVAVQVAVPLAIATAGLLCYATIRALRLRRPTPAGVPVTRAQAPRLWAMLDEAAAVSAVAPPDGVTVVAPATATLAEHARFGGLAGGRRELYLGLPLLQAWDEARLRAVVAHELAHGSPKLGGRFAPLARRGRTALARIVPRIPARSPAGPVLRLWARWFRAVDDPRAREQELAADRVAAEFAGPRAAAAVLRDGPVLDGMQQLFHVEYLSPGWQTGLVPDDVFGGFLRVLAARAEDAAVLRARGPEQPGPWDAHPPVAERLAALAAITPEGPEPESPPAGDLIPDLPGLARALQAVAFPSTGRTVVTWDEFFGAARTAEMEREADASLRALSHAAGTPIRTADAVLHLSATGHLPKFAETILGELPPPTTPPDFPPPATSTTAGSSPTAAALTSSTSASAGPTSSTSASAGPTSSTSASAGPTSSTSASAGPVSPTAPSAGPASSAGSGAPAGPSGGPGALAASSGGSASVAAPSAGPGSFGAAMPGFPSESTPQPGDALPAEGAAPFTGRLPSEEIAGRVTELITLLLALAALHCGAARWRHSWTGTAELVAADGSHLDLHGPAMLAANPATVAEARQWLSALDIDLTAAAGDPARPAARVPVLGGVVNVLVDGARTDLLVVETGLLLVPGLPRSRHAEAKRRLTQLASDGVLADGSPATHPHPTPADPPPPEPTTSDPTTFNPSVPDPSAPDPSAPDPSASGGAPSGAPGAVATLTATATGAGLGMRFVPFADVASAAVVRNGRRAWEIGLRHGGSLSVRTALDSEELPGGWAALDEAVSFLTRTR